MILFRLKLTVAAHVDSFQFQTFETSDVHAFVMFIDTSSMTDVKSSGTNLGAKFVQSNPDIRKAFETFCEYITKLLTFKVTVHK